MVVTQARWSVGRGWSRQEPGPWDLVLAFGSRDLLTTTAALAELGVAWPARHSVGCSTAGDIADLSVCDDELVVTAIRFEHTAVRGTSVTLAEAGSSRAAGAALAARLAGPDLVHVLLLSDGLVVNGSELSAGAAAQLPAGVTVTGGLASDGAPFERTVVHLDGELASGRVAAIGLYGDRLRVGCGSVGGWDPFGPHRLVTRAEGSVLFELDGVPALDVYRRYLGDEAAGLPGTGLLFPLAILPPDRRGVPIVRTVLAIDEAQRSVRFAGDLPQGGYAQLMKANFDRLVDGAVGAARLCRTDPEDRGADLALLISCIGRRMILQQRVEEELEAVREVLGPRPVLTGFYSNGEIAPVVRGAPCELHNQTMTVTTFSER